MELKLSKPLPQNCSRGKQRHRLTLNIIKFRVNINFKENPYKNRIYNFQNSKWRKRNKETWIILQKAQKSGGGGGRSNKQGKNVRYKQVQI